VAFYLLLRPLFFGTSAAFNGIVLPPNLSPLIQSRLHRWSLGHSVTFFDNDFAGRIAQKQMQTATALVNVVTEVINAGAFAVATLIGSVAMLTAIDWRIGLGLLLWLAGYILMIRWFLPRIRVRSKDRAAARANVTGQIVDTITNIKTVKLFGHTDHEDEAAIDALQGYRQTALAFGYLSTGFRFALMATAGVLPVVLVLGAIVLWQNGLATPGEIAATGAIAMRIAQMTGWVSFTLMAVYANIGEIEDGMRTLTPPHTLTDEPEAVELPRIRGRIAYENVTFAYGREVGGVESIDLVIEPGQKLGIVGCVGGGEIDARVASPAALRHRRGRMTLDGTDIRSVTQDSLRHQIAMVTQETAMFNRSAMENIRYGRPEATDEEVFAAARRAEAHDFIQTLRDHRGREGYDAHLGERGVKLSGGQRQRIALARAFLKDAPVLVLDEATSALDSRGRGRDPVDADRHHGGQDGDRHRAPPVDLGGDGPDHRAGRGPDRGGRAHEDLLAQGGLYARYWNRQSGGFIHAEAAE
jgi:ATP-binding cassette subfamily B protein